jgi:hypothetical protein
MANSTLQSNLSAGSKGTEKEIAMQRLRIERPKQSRVIAVFESSAAFCHGRDIEDLAATWPTERTA